MVAGLRARWQERPIAVAVIVAVVTAIVFLPALGNGFVRYDDQGYVTENRVVLDGLSAEAVRWSFTTLSMSNWHPLTWLSYLVDSSLFGIEPMGFHATNVILHALCAALVVLVASSLTGDVLIGAAVALLFALHPLRVESVAWISERKDVLSGVFFLLTILWYVKAVRASSRRWHALALASFALGLMAKSMLVTVPALLLVIDVCFLHRRDVARALLEKLPYVALAAIVAALTVVAQSGAIVDVAAHGPAARAGNAVVSLARYLAKTAWPVDLSVAYRVPPDGWPALTVVASAALIAALTVAFVLIAWRTRDARTLGGWLWFLGMLVPVLGLVQVGGAAMADRYTYLPHVGLLLAVVLGAQLGVQRMVKERWLVAAVVVAIVLALACVPRTIDQIAVWSSSRTLFTHALALAPEHPWLRMYLALALVIESDDEEDARRAVREGATAMEQQREDPALLAQFGIVLSQAGQRVEAERALRAVLQVDPQNAVAREELERIMRSER